MHIYDYIIIGSGLTGQTIATALSQETKNVLLLEAEPFNGGSHRPTQLKNRTLDSGLRFIPENEMTSKALLFIENLLGLKLIKKSLTNQPQTYDSSGFKSFVGFGDHAPGFYDEFSYFLNAQEIELTLPLHQILSLLSEKYQGEKLLKSHVTQFNFSHTSENPKSEPELTHVTVNGTKQFHAKNFIFTGSVKDLAHLLPDDVLNIRAKTKLKKDTYWMTLCLDLFHEGAVFIDNKPDESNIFILDGTTDDSIGPCIGRFGSILEAELSPTQKSQQVSQWLSFIDFNTAEETENTGEVLKKMKRQIKRAFPELAESVIAERIFMSPPITGGELKLNANGTLAKTNNLWIASSQMSPFSNLMGSLMQSQLTLAALGFSDFKVSLPACTEEMASIELSN